MDISPDMLPVEEFEARLAAALNNQRAPDLTTQYPGIRPDLLVQMALLPSWTLPLIQKSEIGSSWGERIESELDELEKRHLVEVGRSPFEEEKGQPATYRLNSLARAQILQPYLNDPRQREEARDIAKRLSNRILAVREEAELLPKTLRWAELARWAGSAAEFAENFERVIAEAQDGGTILAYLDAAREITPLFGADDSASVALERAGRRVELLHRREIDAQHLRYLLERPELNAAFHALMDPRDQEHWALHYLGAGGVGKTMLLRQITYQLAERHGAAAARVDFDFMNPDYPNLSPGLLIWSFVQELSAYPAFSQARRSFERADDLLRAQRQRLRSGSPAANQRSTDDPDFREAVARYIEGFRAMDMGLLLIIDTCEELAKARPENVDETFRILRALHDGPQTLDNEPPDANRRGVPRLRVIFAGRRLLAPSGYLWEANVNPEVAKLEPRPFLRLCEIRGFLDQEADRFLGEKMNVRQGLWQAIKDKSRWEGPGGYPVTYTNASDAPVDSVRYHPFDLRFFGGWALDDPNLEKETIESATNAQYIEMRIIGRLRDPALERALPLIAVSHHADFEAFSTMLAAGDDAQAAFLRLRQQDWTGEHRVTSGDGKQSRVVVDAEAGICSRLIDYYQSKGVSLSAVREKAAEHLIRRTLEDDLSTLDWSLFDAALRVLRDDRDRAVEWWERFEARLLRERGFQWASDLIRPLLAEDGIAGAKEKHPLRWWVMTTYASAMMRVSADQASPAWFEVTKSDVVRLRRLALVAHLGAALKYYGEWHSSLKWVLSLEESRKDPEFAAACCGVLEAVCRFLAKEGSPAELKLDAAANWAKSLEVPEFRSYALMLAARLMDFTGNSAAALDLCRRSLGEIETVPDGEFLAWVRSPDIRARIRLHAVLLLRKLSDSPPKEILEQIGRYQTSIDTVEGERLVSAALQLKLAQRPVDASELPQGWPKGVVPDRLQEKDITAGPAPAELQGIAPAMVATAAEVLASTGQFDAALNMLRAVSKNASALSLELVQECERVLLKLCFRLRIDADRSARSLENSVPDDLALLWACDSFRGDRSSAPSPAEFPSQRPLPLLHAIWRTRFGPNRRDSRWEELSPELTNANTFDAHFSFEEVSVSFDAEEMRRLNGSGRSDFSFHPEAWYQSHRDQPENAWRLLLRHAALTQDLASSAETASTLRTRLGARTAGYVALAEANLLALRLPQEAATLYQAATLCFEQCSDLVGETLALTPLLMQQRRTGEPKSMDIAGRLRAAFSEIPFANIWEDAEKAAQRPSAENLARLSRSAWCGISARIALCLAEHGRKSSGPLFVWTMRTFASSPSDKQKLPADLADWFVESRFSVVLGKIGSIGGQVVGSILIIAFAMWLLKPLFPVGRSFGFGVAEFLVAIAALTITGIVLGDALQERLRSLTRTIYFYGLIAVLVVAMFKSVDSGTESTLALIIRLIATVIVVIGAAIPVVRDLRSFILSQLPILARLTKIGADRISIEVFTTRIGVHWSLRPLLQNVFGAREEFPLPVVSPYADLQLPSTIAAGMDQMRKLTAKRTQELEFEVGDSLHGIPWEAMFGMRSPDDIKLAFRRTCAGKTPRAFDWPKVLQVGWLTESPVPPLTAAWTDASSNRFEFGRAPGECHILHMAGAAERSNSGVRFRLAKEEIVMQSSASIESADTGRTYFRPEDISEQFRNVRLLILQGEASPGAGERVDGDRLDAASMRRFAAAVFSQGIPMVVVVPPLEGALAAKVISGIIKALGRRVPWPVGLVSRALAEARAEIFENSPVGPSRERAFDVCLYGTSNPFREKIFAKTPERKE